MLNARAIYFIATERQAADRRRTEGDLRAMYARPDCPPHALGDAGERRRVALGSFRRWFVGSHAAEALR
jgi:hypothetical protein